MKTKHYALLFNDLHISKDTISDFIKNWQEALEICQEKEINKIIIGGDLWQSRSHQTLSTLLAVSEMIKQTNAKNISLLIAEGNHDLVNQEEYFGYSHIFSEYPNVNVVDVYHTDTLGNGDKLVTMSYFPENGSFTSHLDKVKSEVEPSKTILYIHEGINGALAQSNEKELPTNIFDGFKAVLVGHYHNRTKIKGTTIEYIGGSRQHNFGEDEDKGYTILNNDGSYYFVKNQANDRYTTKEYKLSQITDNAYKEIKKLSSSVPKYKVRVIINCTDIEAKTIDTHRFLEHGATKVEIRTDSMEYKDNVSKAIEFKYDKEKIKDAYVDFCNEEAINNVELGIAYLNKID